MRSEQSTIERIVMSRVPVVILAGGQGARFDHESQVRPKPMIEVAGRPILQHIIDSFSSQGFREFIVLGGHLVGQIRDHFVGTGHMIAMGLDESDRWWQFGVEYPDRYGISVTVADTGKDSHTGIRLWRARSLIRSRRFVLTYGDGLCNVSMHDVLEQHVTTGAGVTLTAVRPPGRFGVIHFGSEQSGLPYPSGMGLVDEFSEKTSRDWINGGFMAVEPEFIEQYIEGEFELESTALPELAASGGLHAYRHDGYWHCMDTRRDRDQIEQDVKRHGRLPWMR